MEADRSVNRPSSRVLRIISVAGLVLFGVLGALASLLGAVTLLPPSAQSARLGQVDFAALAMCGLGFFGVLAVPTMAWWKLLPGTRRAGLVTMAVIAVLLEATGITVLAVWMTGPHSRTSLDLQIERPDFPLAPLPTLIWEDRPTPSPVGPGPGPAR